MSFLYTERIKRIELPDHRTPVNIWFFGDIHRDTDACDVDRWKTWLKTAKDDDAYFVGMGDFHDFTSTSEKKALVRAGLHETTLETFDHHVQKLNRDFAKEIGFMRGKLLCLVEGNHNWKFANSKTSTEDLAERLDTECVGWLCHYTLIFSFKNRSLTKSAIRMVLCHGRAGGKTAGITINQVDYLRTLFPVADLYVMGHDHQVGAWPESVLVPDSMTSKVRQKRQLLCRSGSYKRAYVDGRESYEVSKLLRPADLGSLKLTINFTRNRKSDSDIIEHYIKSEI